MDVDGSGTPPIRIQLLGPVGLFVDDRPVQIGGPGVRGLLAMLALRANSVVTMDDIIDSLWGNDPPATARTIVQGNVSQLRRVLRGLAGENPAAERVAIATRPTGYQLTIPSSWIDAGRARMLLEAAGTAATGRRAELLASAFGLWQGQTLGGTPESVRVRASELEDLRFAVHGARIDADMDLGRHAELVAELIPLVRENPLAERTVGQLMLALCRAGRRADALEVFRRVAKHSTAVLGIGPGPELQMLHEQVLRDDPTLSGTVAAPDLARLRPAQLPPSVPKLAGRRSDLDWLDELRAVAVAGGNATGVVTGPAGVGKSALVLSWAHRLAGAFSGGMLFAWLRGFDPNQPALEPAEVLTRFLGGLGVDAAEVPERLDDRVALYRSLLAGRKVLVLLDDAISADQVRPLLPPGNGSMALVTSRYRLDGLAVSNAARLRPLGTLPPQEAVRLVEELAGTDGTGRAQRVAELCGHLPLALRIAGARLAGSPQWMVDEVVADLEDETTRLTALDIGAGELSVRAALEVSVQGLDPAAAYTFSVLGVHTGPRVSTQVVAALAEVDVPVARERLRLLSSQHLLTEVGRDVFEPHDLVRLYLRELAEALTADQRQRLRRRAVYYYLGAADAARQLLGRVSDNVDYPRMIAEENLPSFPDQDRALDWFAAEWPNLLALLDNAAAAGFDEEVWKLVRMLHGYRRVRPQWDDWLALADTGIAAAERTGDRIALFWMLMTRSGARITLGSDEGTVAEAEKAYRLGRPGDGDVVERSRAMQLGCALATSGRHEEARGYLRTALDISNRFDDDTLRSQALSNCAWNESRAGRLGEAIEYQKAALEIDRQFDDNGNAVSSMCTLAEICLWDKDYDAAEKWSREAIELCAGRDITMEEADVRLCLGRTLRAKGEATQARAELLLSLDLHRRVSSLRGKEVEDELAALDAGEA